MAAKNVSCGDPAIHRCFPPLWRSLQTLPTVPLVATVDEAEAD